MINEKIKIIIVLSAIFMAGCSTSPIANLNETMVIKSVTISPETIAPGGYAMLSIDALDTDGNELFYRIGTGETLALKDNKNYIFQAPQQAGSQEISLTITNGRKDVYKTINLSIDNSLATSITGGTVELPADKSFDFFTGTVKNIYWGQMEYDNYYGLEFSGNGSGGYHSYDYFSGGIVNLTYILKVKGLSNVTIPYSGYYRKNAPRDSENVDKDQKLAAGDLYGIWFIKDGISYFAKIKTLEVAREKVKFEWVLQTNPSKRRFYD